MDATERLDRHALVMAIWTPAAFLAAALLHRGIVLEGGAWWIAAGFALILVAFAGHVVVNAVLLTPFSFGEVALGAVAYTVALLALLLAALLGELTSEAFLATGVGLASLVGATVAYMIIAFGPRRAFQKFDVIRDNNLRAASRLPHRGGRR